MKLGYVRVSSVSQNMERQMQVLSGVADEIYSEKVSGKRDSVRPELEKLLLCVRKDDEVLCLCMDRLGRSVEDLLKIAAHIVNKGATLRFIQEGLVIDGSPHSKFLLGIWASLAEFERSISKERQREGIAIARANKKYRGGVPKLTMAQFMECLALLKEGKTKDFVAREFNITTRTLYKMLSDHKKGSLVVKQGHIGS